jgi:hypothetical protein
VTYSKFAVLMIAAFAATTASGYVQQAPDSAPVSATAASTTPASSAPAASTEPAATAAAASGPASEADETAALIAKANAAATANAKAAETAARTPATKIEPSAEARKKASEFGFHAEIFDGKTMFCKQDAALGSRLTSKRCMGAIQFEDYSVQLKIARDMMQSKTACQGGKVLGGPCGGLP